MPGIIRHPAVAGRFYPSEPGELLESLDSFLHPHEPSIRAIGCVVPHAGYVYSGAVAGAVFRRIEVPQRSIILCPNHTGRGTSLSIMSEGAWQTPLGLVAIDSQLAVALKQAFPLLKEDWQAHLHEHAIEVELPFLQVRWDQARQGQMGGRTNLTFVPIVLGTIDFEVLTALGNALAQVVVGQRDHVLIIASSDMNHYESDEVTRVKDHRAIEKILALDTRGLFEVAEKEHITMCGLGPTVSMITAAQHLHATHADLAAYATSADISGDYRRVVGYAGILLH
ncbi:MAG: AmmeMemoRadiSam system protein B [Terriglobales bacterium]|jgi:AmmeMemoRadiSam system protein B